MEENSVSVCLDLPENHGKILCLPNFMSLKCNCACVLRHIQYSTTHFMLCDDATDSIGHVQMLSSMCSIRN